jgi:glycosyltransferase involved in cell wall biosynthesis
MATIRQVLRRSMPEAQANTLAWQLLLGQIDSYRLSLAAPILEMASGVIVHNRFALNRLQAEHPQAKTCLIWHPTPIREHLGDKALLRQRYGFSPEDFLIVSVSRLAYNKRIDLVLRCLARLVKTNPAARLILVGEGELGRPAQKLIAGHQLEPHVVRTGWVDAEAYQDYIDMADVAVDLRYPTAGETSGGSLRLLQAGKPIIATAQGFFLELPGQCCILVQPGADDEAEQVLAALEKLSIDIEYRKAIGQAAREFALRHLRREDAAQKYIDFCRQIPASTVPAHTWSLPQAPLSPVIRLVYNCGRVLQYARKYGFAGLLARLKRSM